MKSDISAIDLKNSLESVIKEKVYVERSGTCSGYTWKITWVGVGGDKELLEVDGTKLMGILVSINSKELQFGGMIHGPLSGEFLQTAEKETQVNKYELSCILYRIILFKPIKILCQLCKPIKILFLLCKLIKSAHCKQYKMCSFKPPKP